MLYEGGGETIVLAFVAKWKLERQRFSDDVNPNNNKGRSAGKAKYSYAAKFKEADGWMLYDEANSSGYYNEPCEQLRKELIVAVKIASS